MDIQEEDFNSPQQNKPLSLRKPKQSKQTLSKNAKISSNDILNGEIILENEQIEFIHKKRYRLINNTELINNNIESNKKYKDYEEEQLCNKIIDIYNQLQVQTSKEIKEGEYDSEYHDKREAIVLELLKNVNLFNDIRKLSTKTKNENIYCTILDIFNDFCYYNNQFMIDSQKYLIGIMDNAFEYDNNFKSVSLAVKFCYSVVDFGFFEEYREKYLDYFIGVTLDDKKNNYINSVQGAKTYLYYIIYLIFKDAWENINLNQEIFQKFIGRVLSDININNYNLVEVIILLVNTMCQPSPLRNLVLPLVSIVLQVAHIRDVTHIAYLVAEVLQVAEENVEGDGWARVTEMWVTIDRRSTDIHTHIGAVERFKTFFLTRQRIINKECLFHILPLFIF